MKQSELRQIIREEIQNLQEGSFKRGYWITLYGTGGELDKEFTENRAGIKKIIIPWLRNIDDGDSISVDSGESER